MKKRIFSTLTAAAITLSLLPQAFAFSYNDMQKEFSVSGYEITTVAPDVRHIGLRAYDTAGNQNINAVEFNPKSAYTALRAGKSQGYVWSTQTVKTIANNMSDINGDVAVAAINGDFFTFGVGVPHGVFIEDGIILSTPPQYYAAFGLTYDNDPFIVRHGTILDKIFRINGVLADVSGINMAHAKDADSLMLYTEEYARGTKTGTETYELRCRINSGAVRHGDTLNFTVEEINDAVGNTTLGDGYIVLSAQGEKSIATLKQLGIGETHEMSFRFNEFWSNVKFAVGGIELLLKDGEVYSTSDKSNQPRTSIGIRADGTVVMATFDGRGAGGAAGMSYESAAKAMRALGCVDALNLDGGGSTTFVLRNPGDMEASVVNNLSGSSARQIANALVLMNTTPKQYSPSQLVVSPKKQTVLLGGKYNLSVTGAYDESYKPHDVPSELFWTTDSDINEMSVTGEFTAYEPGEFTVTAASATAEGSSSVKVTDYVDTITSEVSEIEANAGETVEIKVSASLNGEPVLSSPELFSWSAPESLGVFNTPGVLTLSETATEGKITVSYGESFTTVKIIPKTPPVTITGFEDDNVTFIPMPIGTKVNPNFKLETEANLVHDDSRSLKFYYNFLNTTGSVGSYVMVSPESANNSAYILATAPKKLSMRVLGDASGVELRSIIEDANGTQHTISYGKVEHSGWGYMEAALPEGIATPIYVKVPVHLVSNPEKLTHGCLYFDTLRAIYSETDEDTTAPSVTKAWPSENLLIYAKNPSIGVILADDASGIVPASVELHVNGWNCTDREYDSVTGKISYTVKNALKPGYHTIVVRARDGAGNLFVREWKFEVR